MATLQDYLGITALRDAWPKWKANVIAINNQVINHVAGSADKHAAQDITYTGDFVGKTEVKAALDQAKTEIDTIVVNASVDPEVALARDSTVKGETFDTLDARLEEDEQDLVSYKADNAISIKDYGAKNDDSEDISTALLAALAANDSRGGGKLLFPAGTYKQLNPVVKVLTNDLTIEFASGASINGVAATTDLLLDIGGSVINTELLTIDAAKGAYTIESSIGSELVKNDVILITSTDLWDSSREYYFKGELARVGSVSGDSITLLNPLYDSYTAITTSVKKINAPKIVINGLKIKRNSNQAAIQIKYAKDIEIKNCDITGARNWCMTLYWIIGGEVGNCYMSDFWYLGTVQSYGLCVATCQDINVYNNRIFGGRHAITLGGREPCRNIRIDSNDLSSYKSAAIGLHENSEFTYIENNNVTNGISAMGGTCVIKNNKVTCDIIRPAILITVKRNSDIVCRDNDIVQNTQSGGLRLNITVNDVVLDYVDISNNIVNSAYTGIYISIGQIPLIIGAKINTLNLSKNHVNADYRGCIISDVTINKLVFDGGSYSATTGIGILINAPVLELIELTNVYTYCANVQESNINCYNEEITADIILKGCKIIGNTASGLYSKFLTTGNMIVEGNLFKNLNMGGFRVFGANVLMIKDNLFTNLYSASTGHTATKIITGVTSTGNFKLMSSAIPTTGIHSTGDIWENSVPIVGQPKRARCTVSGTPGTWVSEGNL